MSENRQVYVGFTCNPDDPTDDVCQGVWGDLARCKADLEQRCREEMLDMSGGFEWRITPRTENWCELWINDPLEPGNDANVFAYIEAVTMERRTTIQRRFT